MAKKSAITKATELIDDLLKIDPALKEHLSKIRNTPGLKDTARVIAQKLYVDSMVPGVGNKAAYDDFLSRPRQGVHVMLDGNSFGQINKKWGQSVGDEAIKAMFGAARRASRASGGKLWRVGGDEGRAHFDSPEQAHTFARSLRAELERLPPVKGEHKHSMSVGLGASPEHAEQALIHAKKAKKLTGLAPGQEMTHAHSLLPGAAGPIKIDPPHADVSAFVQANAPKSPEKP